MIGSYLKYDELTMLNSIDLVNNNIDKLKLADGGTIKLSEFITLKKVKNVMGLVDYYYTNSGNEIKIYNIEYKKILTIYLNDTGSNSYIGDIKELIFVNIYHYFKVFAIIQHNKTTRLVQLSITLNDLSGLTPRIKIYATELMTPISKLYYQGIIASGKTGFYYLDNELNYIPYLKDTKDHKVSLDSPQDSRLYEDNFHNIMLITTKNNISFDIFKINKLDIITSITNLIDDSLSCLINLHGNKNLCSVVIYKTKSEYSVEFHVNDIISI